MSAPSKGFKNTLAHKQGMDAASPAITGSNPVASEAGITASVTAVENVLLGTRKTINLIHDASADSNGTALSVELPYVHGMIGPGVIAESASAGTADEMFLDDAGQSPVTVAYKAVPAGAQVYFDEDGTGDSKLLHKSAVFSFDVFVLLTDGRALRIAYDASADSNGVPVYFDDDAARPTERLLFISPTTTDGTQLTDDKMAYGNMIA